MKIDLSGMEAGSVFWPVHCLQVLAALDGSRQSDSDCGQCEGHPERHPSAPGQVVSRRTS